MSNRSLKKTGKLVGHNAFIAVLCVIWIIPIVWLLVTSFSAYDGMNTSTFFPENWSAVHYKLLLTPDTVNQFPRWFWNTFVIACWTCIISTLFVLMVAYATSVMRFKSRKMLMNMAVVLNLFPGMLAMIAVYFTLKTFNLTNSHIGLVMVYSASSGLGYLIAKGFFDTVPRSLCEAARLDGCNEAMIFWNVVIPTSRPIIVYTVISSFLVPWMDFVYAKMILNAGISANYTVAVGLYRMLDKSLINTYFTQFCCGGVLVSIPDELTAGLDVDQVHSQIAAVQQIIVEIDSNSFSILYFFHIPPGVQPRKSCCDSSYFCFHGTEKGFGFLKGNT